MLIANRSRTDRILYKSNVSANRFHATCYQRASFSGVEPVISLGIAGSVSRDVDSDS